MVTRCTYTILLFSIMLVFVACGRNRRSRAHHRIKTETDTIVASTLRESLEDEAFSILELRSKEEFDMLAPAMPGYVPSQILEKVGYITSYNHYTKCPNWVAWHLLSDKTNGQYSRKGVPYYDEDGTVYGIGIITKEIARGDYITDMEAEEPRQEITDWDDKLPNNSHGHICPAADNRWSKTAMNQSFLLTNMCPQDRDLNEGDWAGLEDRCRGWAKRYGEVYIVAGPVFYNGVTKTMGSNKVGVPDAFFKVILCLEKHPKALGFIFPNNGVHHNLDEYMLSVDSVETITGFDFFYNLPDDIECNVEKESNLNVW